MSETRQQESPSEAPRGPSMKLWRITVAAEIQHRVGIAENDTRRVFYLVAEDAKTAMRVAERRYREELKLVRIYSELDPILVERLGRSATRETGGGDLRDAWWRRLLG